MLTFEISKIGMAPPKNKYKTQYPNIIHPENQQQTKTVWDIIMEPLMLLMIIFVLIDYLCAKYVNSHKYLGSMKEKYMHIIIKYLNIFVGDERHIHYYDIDYF